MKSRSPISFSFLPIMTGSDLTTRRLPMMKLSGKEAGPVVWVTGCIHGDEVGGMVVAQEIFKRLSAQGLLKGTLYGIPLMNPIGFEAGSRNITVSGDDMYHENLNRAFPGAKHGSLAERIAHVIFSAITRTTPSLVIDLHNDWVSSIPYTLVDPKPTTTTKETYAQVQRLAHATGFAVVNEEESPDDRDDLRRSLSGSLVAHNIPAFTIELGPAYVVNEHFVELGVQSIMSVLCELGMIATCPPFVYPIPKQFDNKTLRYTHEPRASKSGVVRFVAKPGDAVHEGDVLARVYDSFGGLEETIRANRHALVLGHADYSVAFPGMELFAFGYTS